MNNKNTQWITDESLKFLNFQNENLFKKKVTEELIFSKQKFSKHLENKYRTSSLKIY